MLQVSLQSLSSIDSENTPRYLQKQDVVSTEMDKVNGLDEAFSKSSTEKDLTKLVHVLLENQYVSTISPNFLKLHSSSSDTDREIESEPNNVLPSVLSVVAVSVSDDESVVKLNEADKVANMSSDQGSPEKELVII